MSLAKRLMRKRKRFFKNRKKRLIKKIKIDFKYDEYTEISFFSSGKYLQEDLDTAKEFLDKNNIDYEIIERACSPKTYVICYNGIKEKK